ncbi:MAG: suppressor of fused domain protein, partial [Pseudomonadales bacterium]|nr:suppressor of fused domain protein [Pseudomonadales bacterium]
MNIKEMYIAVKSGDIDQVKKILDQEPNLLNAMVRGESWLNLAASYNNTGMMAVLLESGIPIDVDWNGSDTPLKTAAYKGAFNAIKWLIENGADVNGTPLSAPPLVGAIHSGSLEIVKFLIENGASVDFTWGEVKFTPISFAKSFGASHASIVQFLERGDGKSISCDSVPMSLKDKSHSKIKTFLEREYGPIDSLSLHRIIGNEFIEVVVIRNEDESFITLSTVGLSDFCLDPSGENREGDYVEFMIDLPLDWPLDFSSSEGKNFYWPVAWLFKIADQIISGKSPINFSSAVICSDDIEPLAQNTDFSCWFVYQSLGEEGRMRNADGKFVEFLTLFPLFPEEKKLLLERGPEHLLERFQVFDIPLYIDIERKNSAK